MDMKKLISRKKERQYLKISSSLKKIVETFRCSRLCRSWSGNAGHLTEVTTAEHVINIALIILNTTTKRP